MSLNLNQVTLAGNLTRDPVLRTLPSGTLVAEFGLAINNKYTTKDGGLAEQTCFVEIVTWNKTAQNANTYLKKGSAVLIEGSLNYDKWTTENNEKRSRLRVTAFRIHFVGSRRFDEQAVAQEAQEVVEAAVQDDPTDGLPF